MHSPPTGLPLREVEVAVDAWPKSCDQADARALHRHHVATLWPFGPIPDGGHFVDQDWPVTPASRMSGKEHARLERIARAEAEATGTRKRKVDYQVEWLRFLKQIDRQTPKERDIHRIVDNYCTHKHHKVRDWLGKHPRFHVHFTPTSSSLMNLVERFFADLTREVVRDGSFSSVRELVKDIEHYLAERNAQPQPYRWRARGEEILAKIQRARAAIG